jgi:hypothetical protein
MIFITLSRTYDWVQTYIWGESSGHAKSHAITRELSRIFHFQINKENPKDKP